MEDSIEASEAQPEQILCPSCLKANAAAADFCSECGAPLSALSVIGPWERIQAAGFAYREAVSGPPKPIILLGVWLLFFPGVLASAFWIGHLLPPPTDDRWGPLGTVALLVGSCAICAGILIRATTNYFKKRTAPETER